MKPSVYLIIAKPVEYAIINGIDIRYEYYGEGEKTIRMIDSTRGRLTVITRLNAPEYGPLFHLHTSQDDSQDVFS